MRTLLPCALTLALGSIVALNGCQLTESDTPTKPATVAVSTKTTTKAPQKAQPQKEEYERAPDLSQAEVLSSPHAGAGISATDAAAAKENSGTLLSDANFSSSAGSNEESGATNQGTTQSQMQSNAALADRLEAAPAADNAQLGAADPYSSVSESSAHGGVSNEIVFAQPQNVNTGVSLGQGYGSNSGLNLGTAQGSVSELNGYTEAQQATSGCSITLHNEASGIARTLIRELASRLRNESGNIYVAPTIVDREYKDCVGDLSTALQDGLVSANVFQVVPATSNLNNIASQNIGSASVLPNLIHQCRAADIPYLVVSQIKKQGDNAALTLRIIRTNDGITLSQTFRRLSQ